MNPDLRKPSHQRRHTASVTGLPIPALLARAASQDGPPGLRRWVAALPTTVRDLAERWSLALGEPYEPGGQCSWVAPATNRAGEELVLKVGWSHYEAAHEADGLRVWNGRGAVLLRAAHAWNDTSALLLERCVPGTILKRARTEAEQDVVVAGLLRRLWIEPRPPHPFRPLQQMCDQWATGFEEKLAASPGAIDTGLAREGIALFRSLPATAECSVLLCTDLHAENILAARREPWLVIDPKPYVGDPTYDLLQHMLNCPERLAADPAGMAGRLAGLTDLDPKRVITWLFARCVQESIGDPALVDVARRLAPGIL
jgi:streptomycin 6-kinase